MAKGYLRLAAGYVPGHCDGNHSPAGPVLHTIEADMHELGIASSVLEAVAKEAERRPNTRILKVGLRIGELAAVDRDALTFGWEVLTKDTEWQGLELEIESIPRRQRCTVCGHEFAAPDFMTACPKCAELMTLTIAGDELDIAYLEVEDP